MGGNIAGAGDGKPSFIDLMKPGIDGDQFTNLVLNAKDGSVFGSGSSSATGVANGGDVLQSADTQASVDKLKADLNIYVTLGDQGSMAAMQAKLDTLDPANPDVPVIKSLLALAQKSEMSGKTESGGTTSGTTTKGTAIKTSVRTATVIKLDANKIFDQHMSKELDKALSDAKAAWDDSQKGLEKGKYDATDPDALAADSNIANIIAENANDAATAAEVLEKQAKGSPNEAKSKDVAEQARSYAAKANNNANILKSMIIGEKQVAEAKKDVDIAAQASKDAQSELDKANAAADQPDAAAAEKALANAKDFAEKAKTAAAGAKAAADAAKGTPEEAAATALADDADKSFQDANKAVISAGAAVKNAVLNEKSITAMANLEAAIEVLDQANKEANEAQKVAKLAADRKDGPEADKAAKIAEEALAKAQKASDAAMAIATKAKADGLPNADKLMDKAIDALTSLTLISELDAATESEAARAVAPIAPNLFLAVNAYVTFMVNFMELVKAMLENKKVQGELQLKTMDMIVSLAQDTKATIMDAAQKQSDIYVAQGICAAVALAGSCISFGMTVASMGAGNEKEIDLNEELTPEITVPDPPTKMGFPDDESALNAKIQSDWYEERGGQVATDGEGFEETSTYTDKNGNDVEYKVYGPGGGKEGAAMKKAFENRGSDDHPFVNDQGKTEAQVQAHNDKYDDYHEELYENKLQDPHEKGISSEEKAARQDKIDNRNEEIRTKNEETTKDVKKRNEQIRHRNQSAGDTRRQIGQAIEGMARSGSEVFKNFYEAGKTMEKAQAESLRVVLEAFSRIQQQLLSTVNDAFKADGDTIRELIQQLDGIRQKLLEAVAAMLRR